jgi:hypothetical protein
MVFRRLEREPATPKMLEDELNLGHSSVMYALRDSILADLGFFKKLPNDKYTVRSFNVEEYEIKTAYNGLKKKLLRSPTPEEFAGHINRKLDESRDLLLKNVPGYREPMDEEKVAAANKLWKMVVLYFWNENGLPASKKDWFERDIRRVVIEGIDSETIQVVLKSKPHNDPDEIREYMDTFPEMKPKVAPGETSFELIYKISWTEELKNALHPIKPWNQTSEIRIPRRYDFKGDLTWMFGAFESVIELAEIYSPSSEVIDLL